MEMKKLLAIAISAVFMASAQAQETESGNIRVEFVGHGIDVSVNEINMGTLMPPASAESVILSCSSGTPDITPASIEVTAGSCGEVVVSTVSPSNITFRVSATADISQFTNAAVNVFPENGDTSVSPTADHSVNSGSNQTFYLGVNLGTVQPTQTAGNYTGTYTFTATIQ